MRELAAKLPALEALLHAGEHVTTLHGTVEMIAALVAGYERGEIVEHA